jgi:endonuclease/exonuclease/phosphatase family metal-dependent hydrolase
VLDRWCDSVGPPLLVPVPAVSDTVITLVVASWNTHVGAGDVDRLLDWIARAPGVRRPYAVVLLLQEAVRGGAGVPSSYPPGMRPPRALGAHAAAREIDAVASRLSMHLAYVPSMRNGGTASDRSPEDRGNAILSTLPLRDVAALELPFGKQRHVAVAATIDFPGFEPLRVLTVHLDPSGHRAEEAEALATHLSKSSGGPPWIVGGDLNTWFGRGEPAFTAMTAGIPEADCGREKTNSWPWQLHVPLGWWRGRLDYVFSSLASGGVGMRCETVDHRFGSDHNPLVMVLESTPTSDRSVRARR